MKKFYNFLSFTWLVALTILLSTGGVQAQLAPKYPLTISTGTYSSISATGTSVASGDEVGTNITGFTGFTVNSVTYTNARMCSNGWLALYTTTAPTATANYAALSTAMTDGAVIFAPYGRDLNTDANSGTAWWQQVGNELVFEWKNFNRYAYTDVLNFQIRLNTSTGEIKFVYGTMTPAANTTYPQVGWKTNGTVAANWSTDINNVMIDVTGSPNTCNWSNVVTGNANTSTCYFNSANSGVVPASGLTYSWTKPNGTDPNPVRTFSAVSGITTSTATLTWTAPTGATQYNVQYRAIGSCTWTNFSGNPVSSNSATLTGLSPATTYQIRVQSGNGSVNGLWSHIPNQAGTGSGYVASGTFTTACAAIVSLPWTEGFESATLPNLPSTCWLEDPSSGDWVTTNNSSSTYDADARTGAQFLRDSWGATNEFVWTPGFALTSGQSYDFSFWWAGDTYSGWTGDIFYNTIQSGTGATQMGSSFVTSSTTTTKTYVQDKRTFVAPTTGTYYFAVRVNATSSPWYLSFDDFRFEQTPSCLATTATAASNITATTASANWSTATGSWIIEYGPTATFGTPGTGATAGNVNNTVVTASNVSTISLSGLTASTGYSYVVRQDCSGGGNGYSANSNVITFTTSCNAITSFPWAESFDNASLPTCWTQQYVSGTLNWATVTTNGNSTITPHSGARMAEFRNTTTGSATRLVTPLLDLTSLTNPELTFYFANVNWAGDIDELRVYYSTDGGSTWTLIPGQTYTTEHTSWQEVKVILPSPNSTYMVAFEATSNWARGLDLDDVSIAEAPSCLATTATAASNITATTANANWATATGSWIIEYGPTATFGTPGTGATAGNVNNTVVTASNVSTLLITGLTGGKQYSYVVRMDCTGSGNGYSTNSTKIDFFTLITNDECAGSTNITPTPGKFKSPGLQTTSGGTLSSTTSTCITGEDRDVWYVLTTDNDGVGNENISLTVTPSGTMDVGLTLYSGLCGSLTQVACVDILGDGGAETITYVDPLWKEEIQVRDNTTYYLKVTDYWGDGLTFTITNNGSTALPLTLLSFKAQQVKRGEVLLDWRVKDEVNMKQYDVQRSVDGKNFTTIGTVNNLGKEVYTLIDTKPAQGINYYRLSMVESNGLTNYSHIVAININDGKALHASPNPVTGDLTVEVKGEVGKQAVIDIIDYTGNKVRTVAIPAGKVTVDMTSLPTGVYVVQYIDGTTVYTTRVVKM